MKTTLQPWMPIALRPPPYELCLGQRPLDPVEFIFSFPSKSPSATDRTDATSLFIFLACSIATLTLLWENVATTMPLMKPTKPRNLETCISSLLIAEIRSSISLKTFLPLTAFANWEIKSPDDVNCCFFFADIFQGAVLPTNKGSYMCDLLLRIVRH